MATYQCSECGYQYNEALGDDYEGYPPGRLFSELPDDFACPDCAVCGKPEFVLRTDG